MVEKPKKDSEQKSIIADFFDREHVIETIRVAFKNGPNQRRMRVIMLMVVVMVVIGPLHGTFFQLIILWANGLMILFMFI